MVTSEHHDEGHGEAVEEQRRIHAEDHMKQILMQRSLMQSDAHVKKKPTIALTTNILLHQLQNKPWAALYVAAFFFFMIPLEYLLFMQSNEQLKQDGLQFYSE